MHLTIQENTISNERDRVRRETDRVVDRNVAGCFLYFSGLISLRIEKECKSVVRLAIISSKYVLDLFFYRCTTSLLWICSTANRISDA